MVTNADGTAAGDAGPGAGVPPGSHDVTTAVTVTMWMKATAAYDIY